MTSGIVRIFRSQSRKQYGLTTCRIYTTAIPLACLLAAASASAHHSATQYDRDRRVVLTGSLTKVDWRNPHIEFSLEVKDDRGHGTHWLVESLPPNRYANRNIPKAIFERAVGQILTMEIFPARDGSPYGLLRKVTFSDGSVVSCGDAGVGGSCAWESASHR